jgi:hypothetical protein
LPGKQTKKFLTRRIGFISAAATLLVVMVAWVAVRAVGPTEKRSPILVVPSETADAPRPSFGALPWRTASPSTTPTASTSPVATIPAAAKPSKTTKAPISKPATAATSKPTEKAPTTRPPTSSAPRPAAFTAGYATGASWESGIVAWIQVTNTGGTAAAWKLTLSYESRARVRVTNAWNAQHDRQGETHTFTGATLAPGASVTFGFEATKQVRRDVRPASCAVEGSACRLG